MRATSGCARNSSTGPPNTAQFFAGSGLGPAGAPAVLESVAQVDLRKAGHGSVLDLAFHPSALEGENGLRPLMAFVETFLTMPCSTTLQINSIDRDTLLRGREDPTNPAYRTLLVRVWGFSAARAGKDRTRFSIGGNDLSGVELHSPQYWSISRWYSQTSPEITSRTVTVRFRTEDSSMAKLVARSSRPS